MKREELSFFTPYTQANVQAKVLVNKTKDLNARYVLQLLSPTTKITRELRIHLSSSSFAINIEEAF